jgi:hypothetical protein
MERRAVGRQVVGAHPQRAVGSLAQAPPVEGHPGDQREAGAAIGRPVQAHRRRDRQDKAGGPDHDPGDAGRDLEDPGPGRSRRERRPRVGGSVQRGAQPGADVGDERVDVVGRARIDRGQEQLGGRGADQGVGRQLDPARAAVRRAVQHAGRRAGHHPASGHVDPPRIVGRDRDRVPHVADLTGQRAGGEAAAVVVAAVERGAAREVGYRGPDRPVAADRQRGDVGGADRAGDGLPAARIARHFESVEGAGEQRPAGAPQVDRIVGALEADRRLAVPAPGRAAVARHQEAEGHADRDVVGAPGLKVERRRGREPTVATRRRGRRQEREQRGAADPAAAHCARLGM